MGVPENHTCKRHTIVLMKFGGCGSNMWKLRDREHSILYVCVCVGGGSRGKF